MGFQGVTILLNLHSHPPLLHWPQCIPPGRRLCRLGVQLQKLLDKDGLQLYEAVLRPYFWIGGAVVAIIASLLIMAGLFELRRCFREMETDA